jgi:hypothetical protein
MFRTAFRSRAKVTLETSIHLMIWKVPAKPIYTMIVIPDPEVIGEHILFSWMKVSIVIASIPPIYIPFYFLFFESFIPRFSSPLFQSPGQKRRSFHRHILIYYFFSQTAHKRTLWSHVISSIPKYYELFKITISSISQKKINSLKFSPCFAEKGGARRKG